MSVDLLAAKEKYIVGEGSFGKVYKYTYNNESYAIKKILKDTKNHPELMEKFEIEGKIMQRASNHRNIVGYLGQRIQGNYLYLLTEFISDGDLRRVNFLPSEDDLWQIIMQLAMGLNHLRKNKIIHRDIKLQNILVKSTYQMGCQPEVVLKITDFGLAEIMDDKTSIQGIAGSPIYLAPEMCKYQYYSYEVDIWSLGITLYQLAHNQKSPYHEELLQYMSMNEYKHTEKGLFNYLVSLIESKKIKCSSPYTEINQLIESMLNHDPKKRPTPLNILQHRKVLQRLIKFNKNNKNNMFMGKTLSTKESSHCGKSAKNENKNSQSNLSPEQEKGLQLMIYSQSIELFLSSRVSNSLIQSLKSNSELNPETKSYELISFELLQSKI